MSEAATVPCPECQAKLAIDRPLSLEQLDPKPCRHCLRVNSPNAIRCTYCAQPFGPATLSIPNAKRACPECHQEIPIDSRLCPLCDVQLSRARSRLADDDAEPDAVAAGFGLLFLAGVGALGILISFNSTAHSENVPGMAAYAIAIVAGIAIRLTGTKPFGQGSGGTVLLVMAGFGLVFLLIFSRFLFAFGACVAG